MAIRDRNGDIYKLRGPNPVMETQTKWDTSQIKLINFKFGKETIVDPSYINIVKEPEKEPEAISISGRDFLEEIDQTTNQLVTLAEPEPIVEPIREEVPQTNPIAIPESLRHRIVTIQCAPVLPNKTWGEPFNFEAIPVSVTDVQYQFWTLLKVSVGSIIFPITNERRWWKVNETTAKTGGYISTCSISVINPDFTAG